MSSVFFCHLKFLKQGSIFTSFLRFFYSISALNRSAESVSSFILQAINIIWLSHKFMPPPSQIFKLMLEPLRIAHIDGRVVMIKMILFSSILLTLLTLLTLYLLTLLKLYIHFSQYSLLICGVHKDFNINFKFYVGGC